MSSKSTPKNSRTPLTTLTKLSTQQFEALLSSFDASHSYASRAQVQQGVAKGLPDVDTQLRNDLMDFALAYAEVALERGKLDDDDFLDGLVRATQDELGDEPANTRNRIRALLRAPALQIMARSTFLDRHHGRPMLRSAIDTDLRPVFVPHVDERPAAYIIWHSLYVVSAHDIYGQQEDTTEFSLDHRDLIDLKKQIDEALSRHDRLKAQISESAAVWDSYESRKGDE